MDINLGLADIYIVFKPWDWMTSAPSGSGPGQGRLSGAGTGVDTATEVSPPGHTLPWAGAVFRGPSVSLPGNLRLEPEPAAVRRLSEGLENIQGGSLPGNLVPTRQKSGFFGL